MSDHMAQRMDDLIEAGKHWEAEKPLNDLCEHFLSHSHEDLAEAFATVDWVLREFYIPNDQLSEGGQAQKALIHQVLLSWPQVKSEYIPGTR